METWSPTDNLKAAIAAAAVAEGSPTQSLDDALSVVLNSYYGYRRAYGEVVIERTDLTHRIASIESERDGYKAAYGEITIERTNLVSGLASLEAERDGFKSGYDDLTRERTALISRVASLEAERDGFRSGYDDLTRERTTLLGRVASLEAERDGFKGGYDDLTRERTTLLGRVASLEAERDGFKGGYDDLTRERTKLLGRIASLEAERDGFKSGYEDLQTLRSQLVHQLSNALNEREGFKRGYDEAAAAHGELAGHLATVTLERDGLDEALRIVTAERDEARAASRLRPNAGPRRPRGLMVASHGTEDALTTIEAGAMTGMMELDRLVQAGKVAEGNGDRDSAIAAYLSAMRQLHRYAPARIEASRLARDLFKDAIDQRDHGRVDEAIATLVRSLELDPHSQEVRDSLQRLLNRNPGRDLTQECLIFPDAARANEFYRDAIQTCMDFVVHGGIIGDILEFGVLGGWTARHLAEIARDSSFYGDLHLFDSFEGLPRDKVAIDAASYDVVRGVWREEMKLPSSWEAELGGPIDEHVGHMLAQVLPPSRIKIRKGFFAQSLAHPLNCQAALVHLDCDLYQSTVEVFQALERDHVLQDGTILMFDDWNCNRANPAFGQRRAFAEFLDRNRGNWSASHYLNYGFNCAAFILHQHSAGSTPSPARL